MNRKFRASRSIGPVGLGLVALLLVLVLTGTSSAESGGQAGTTLTASVTANTSYVKEYTWQIHKNVTPDSWDIFKGDSATSEYTVGVERENPTERAWIEGNVTVHNGGGVSTENLSVILELRDGVPPPDDLLGIYPLDISANPVLDPGETGTYPYRIYLTPAQVHAGGNYKVTANVTITNHSGRLGTPFGPGPSATATLPVSPVTLNECIHVDDTSGESWLFNDSGSVTYTRRFTGAGTYNNTATIRETGQSASASVRVNVYELMVSKNATPSYTRTYTWNISKEADLREVTVNMGDTVTVNYTVNISVDTGTDSDWMVGGTITVFNPAPIVAVINSISDTVSPGVLMNLTGATFPHVLEPGGTLVLNYMGRLPDGSSRVNTATVVQQNHDHYLDSSDMAGFTEYTAMADVEFGEPSELVDESVTVSDDRWGYLGVISVGSDIMPGETYTFNYSVTYGPYSAPGLYTEVNEASFVTCDSSTGGSDSWLVDVYVRSSYGTLTIGYWKTHAGFNGNNQDAVTPLLGTGLWLGTAGGDRSVLVTTAEQAVRILSFNGSASNGINKLYAQLLAAKLNMLNGAYASPQVLSVIAQADAFLATHDASSWSSLSKKDQQKVLQWMSMLDKYNNGML